MTTKELGKHFEHQALQYLTKQGLKLIKKNFFCRFGEIDLIVLDQSTLVFVEVRFRKKISHGSAMESVTFSKQQKLRKTAQYFLLAHRQYQQYACRFDVVAIDGEKTDWIKGGFY